MKLLRIAFLMCLQYGLVVLNTRAIAVRSYTGTIGSDALIAANGIILTKFAVAAKTPGEWAAYIIGGCSGSLLSLWLTKQFGI